MFIPLYDANPLRHIGRPYVTWTIAALCVLAHLLVSVQPGDAIDRAAIAYGVIPSVVEGIRRLPMDFEVLPAWVTLVTYAFLHGDWMHLAGYMLFLLVFGDNVEDAMGHVRFLVFYLAGAVGSALVHIVLHPGSDSPLVGASGAVAAVVAAYLMLHPRVRLWVLALGRFPLPIPAWLALGGWILFQIYNLFVVTDEVVAWWAHIGGLAVGAVLLPLFKRRDVPLFDRGAPETG